MTLRPRDVRTIVMCVVSTFVVLFIASVLMDVAIGAAVALAFAVMLNFVPRVARMRRRLTRNSGLDWSNYHDN